MNDRELKAFRLCIVEVHCILKNGRGLTEQERNDLLGQRTYAQLVSATVEALKELPDLILNNKTIY